MIIICETIIRYRFFTGLIDDVRIYDELLDADAIYAIYEEGIVPEPTTVSLIGLGSLLLRRRGKKQLSSK